MLYNSIKRYNIQENGIDWFKWSQTFQSSHWSATTQSHICKIAIFLRKIKSTVLGIGLKVVIGMKHFDRSTPIYSHLEILLVVLPSYQQGLYSNRSPPEPGRRPFFLQKTSKNILKDPLSYMGLLKFFVKTHYK